MLFSFPLSSLTQVLDDVPSRQKQSPVHPSIAVRPELQGVIASSRQQARWFSPPQGVGVRRAVSGPCQRRISRIRSTSGLCRGYALVVRGFVHSQPALKTDASAATNAETIGTLTGLRCVGVLAHCTDPAVAARTFDLDALL